MDIPVSLRKHRVVEKRAEAEDLRDVQRRVPPNQRKLTNVDMYHAAFVPDPNDEIMM